MTAEPTYEYAVAWVRPDTGEEATAPMKSEAEALQEAQRLNIWMFIYRPVRRLVTPWEDVPASAPQGEPEPPDEWIHDLPLLGEDD